MDPQEQKGISGVFNIGTGKAVTINLLAQLMKEIFNNDSPIVYSLPRKGEVLHSLADISKAKEILGFEPSTDLYSNLSEYINWYNSDLK